MQRSRLNRLGRVLFNFWYMILAVIIIGFLAVVALFYFQGGFFF